VVAIYNTSSHHAADDEYLLHGTYHLIYFNSLYTCVNPTKIAENVRDDQGEEIAYKDSSKVMQA
jgi:hypothetical protein